MLHPRNIKLFPHHSYHRHEAGFTLIELIVTLVLIGIIASVVGPFLGQAMNNFLQVRQMSERENQAAPALERFVRDVRNSADANANGNTLELTLDGESVIYTIDNHRLIRQDKTLARHISSDSEFHSVQPAGNNSYTLYILDLRVELNSGDPLEYSSAAVVRE